MALPSLASIRSLTPTLESKVLSSLKKPTLTRLANGMRVALDKRPGVTSTFGIWVDAGSRYETEINNGTAHFLEHLIFKGTENQTRDQLERRFENAGAHLNAYTARENTAYFVKSVTSDVPELMGALSDIMQHSLFADSDIVPERSVIMAEMQEVERSVHEVIMDHVHRTAYTNNGLSHTILGSKYNIEERITHDFIKSYLAEHYVANRMCLVVVGDHEVDEINELAEKHFGNVKSGAPATFSSKWEETPIIVQPYDMAHAHTALVWRVAGCLHEDYTALALWEHVFGHWKRTKGYNTSPLALALKGMIASTEPYLTGYADTGVLGTYIVNEKGVSTKEIVQVATAEVHRLIKELTQADLDRAKALFTTKLLYDTDGFTALADSVGRNVLIYDDIKPMDSYLPAINAITVDDMKRVGEKWLSCDPYQVHMGPIEDLPPTTEPHWEPVEAKSENPQSGWFSSFFGRRK